MHRCCYEQFKAGRASGILQFAGAILHGDELHRKWLLDAATQYITDGTVPRPYEKEKTNAEDDAEQQVEQP